IQRTRRSALRFHFRIQKQESEFLLAKNCYVGFMATETLKPGTASPLRFVSDEARWNAVVRRDPRADGQFYFSVKTTGVYCRPSCAARGARRENVQFHVSCKAAE